MAASDVAVLELKTETTPAGLPWYAGGMALVAAIALVKLALHLYAARFYGYFVDELYFMACSRHLAAGYVDQPPLIAFIVRFERILFGDSLQSIRFLAAVAGAGKVVLAGWMARELGGRRWAMAMAALATLMCTGYLAMDHYVSMNAFEPIFWMGSAAVVIRIIKTGNQKLWLWFGLIAGLGLENKHSMLFFGFGIFIGLLLSQHRAMLRKPWIWLAAAIALVIFLPNLLWNIQHHWPFFELLRNIKASGRNVQLTYWQFIRQQFDLTLPVNGVLWVGGLLWLLLARPARPYRLLATTYIVILGCMLVMDGRTYYMLPAYPMLFAAGGVALESGLAGAWLRWLRPVYVAAVLVMGSLAAPFWVPILPAPTFLAYMKARHAEPTTIENWKKGVMPQFYADMFGWEEMTAVVAKAYNALPPEERARTAIFGGNFGQAGAIDLFGPKYGLPAAIGTHQNYWYWGPRNYAGDSVIVMGARREEVAPFWTDITVVGHVYHPYAMPYEEFDVYLCRGKRASLQEIWPKIKNWR
jgi:4-amino-4-deoxy-L-arabinose transferase-like glycosyltransferase